jgi:hypothetical protein
MRGHLRPSRVEKALNVVMGKGRSRPARGWASEISLRLRFFQACGLASDRASFASSR